MWSAGEKPRSEVSARQRWRTSAAEGAACAHRRRSRSSAALSRFLVSLRAPRSPTHPTTVVTAPSALNTRKNHQWVTTAMPIPASRGSAPVIMVSLARRRDGASTVRGREGFASCAVMPGGGSCSPGQDGELPGAAGSSTRSQLR